VDPCRSHEVQETILEINTLPSLACSLSLSLSIYIYMYNIYIHILYIYIYIYADVALGRLPFDPI